MKKRTSKNIMILNFVLFLFFTGSTKSQTVYTINPDKVLHTLDEKIYGHFLEHIYNSVNNGLWGDLVWNRSLERFNGSVGLWNIKNEIVEQSSLNENVRLLFGDTKWQNYELTLQAQKTGGSEGFLILFRANGENFYWCNLGGWGNTQHAIEKGIPGVRWGVFGTPVAGTIQSNRWYDIRVRCDGHHFQVWLDGSELFDFYDNTGTAHLSGQVGIGTWITQAEYRHFSVTDISDGYTLFSGLPEIEENDAVPLDWRAVGSAVLYASPQALNSHYSIKMVNRQVQEAGIEQNSFYLKNQTYHGSFWAKGTAAGNLQVSLLRGSQILDESTLSAPQPEWQEYIFQLTPSAETSNGTLRIAITDTGTVYLDQISMMGQDAIDNDGFRPDLYKAVEALNPPVIRWPGGYFAEYYRWKDGIGAQHERGIYPIVAWNDQDVNSCGTDEFLKLCRRLGAEPIIVINTGHRYSPVPQAEFIEEAQHWLEYCNGPASSTWGTVRAANGHPEPYNVKFWEMGNEIFLTRNASIYTNFLIDFVPALKAIDPSIKIIACGSGGFDQNWNRTVINRCADLIDYISPHHYEDIANYYSGVRNYENFLIELKEIIAASSNPNIKIYMSEWNVWSGLDWRCGLYAGGMLNIFERQGDMFEIGAPALFLRHSSANDWNNALVNFTNTNWFPGPNYVVMKFWRDHYAPNFIETTGFGFGLNVVSTLSEDGKTIYFKAVNNSSRDLTVTLEIIESFAPRSAKLEQIAPPSLDVQNSYAAPDRILVQKGEATIENQRVNFIIPKLSAVIATISQDADASINNGKDTNAVKDFGLYENFPNPFNPDTSIMYELPKAGHVKLQIIDVLGHMVSVLVDERQEKGVHQIRWNGRDGNGYNVSSGLYFYELTTSSQKFVRKMMLLR
ncbi:T9SS type A sorting domain-containing protein [candidate division KSB1 bacterium]|nr:T9SS type A sorting domain-containing protein [candidate division KSB1 bacterium]